MKNKTIQRRTLLYKSKVEFEDYCINHVEGCTHGCKFPCYAMLIKKKRPHEWADIKIVENALDLLSKEIPKLKDKIKFVHLCFSTDLFMYNQPQVIELSLRILEILKRNHIKYKTLTKGIIPVSVINDIESLTKFFGITNEYGITLTTLDEGYRKEFEPHAAPLVDRIEALKYLSSHGFYTWIYCEPFNPQLTSLDDFKELLEAVSFVKKIVFGSWQYNAKYKDKSKYPRYVKEIREFCYRNDIELKVKKEIRNSI